MRKFPNHTYFTLAALLLAPVLAMAQEPAATRETVPAKTASESLKSPSLSVEEIVEKIRVESVRKAEVEQAAAAEVGKTAAELKEFANSPGSEERTWNESQRIQAWIRWHAEQRKEIEAEAGIVVTAIAPAAVRDLIEAHQAKLDALEVLADHPDSEEAGKAAAARLTDMAMKLWTVQKISIQPQPDTTQP